MPIFIVSLDQVNSMPIITGHLEVIDAKEPLTKPIFR